MKLIFLSHQHRDKAIVGPIAQGLKEVFGEENVFFDDWSIQPGQGIINEMNKGLEKCKVFFFFISENSLESDMVKLEWQNAIMRESKHNVLFVPLRMSNIEMPAIISQKLYLDLYQNGMNITLKQMVDLVQNGKLTPEEYKPYENIVAYVITEEVQEKNQQIVHFYVYAQTFFEPICRLLILSNSRQEDAHLGIEGGGMFASNFYKNVKQLPNGENLNGFYIGKDNGITPGFVVHLVFTISNYIKKPLTVDLMREVKDKEFRSIPITRIKDVNELPN